MNVFIALIIVKPLAGCQLDPSDINGAAVRCYIPAKNENDAPDALKMALNELKFKYTGEECFVREDLVEWDNPNDVLGNRLIFEATNSNKIAFSKFHTWGHDAKDAI